MKKDYEKNENDSGSAGFQPALLPGGHILKTAGWKPADPESFSFFS